VTTASASSSWTVTTDEQGMKLAGEGSVAELNGCAAVFTGSLFNRGDLASRVGALSDDDEGELVLQAYFAWGPDFVQRLKGVFALGVWDGRTTTFLGARDPLGIYPFFYARRNGTTLFSTTADALLAHPLVGTDLNRAALADHLCHRWPDPGETYFSAIRRLPPGHKLTIDGSRSRVERYWNPAPPERDVAWVTEQELDRFDELLEQAIGRALDLGRVGIFLSGGLDSVSVAALATDRSRRDGLPDPWALSLAFPHVEANEEAVQRGIAADLGIPQLLLPFEEAVGKGGLLANALRVSASWPAPLMNTWYPAYEALTFAGAEKGCQVIVTGSGGDEWLGVSPFLAADLMRRGDLRALYRLWGTMHRSYRLSRLATLKSVVWRFSARPILGAFAERRVPWAIRAYRRRAERRSVPDWVAPDASLRAELRERAAWAATQRPTSQSFYFREGQLSLDHALVSMEMEELFETTRRTGLPIRMPYWDADVVDFLYRTPPEFLLEGGLAKGIVRQLLARRFPDFGFERHRKVLATNYFVERMLAEAPSAWREMGGAPALEEAGVLDGKCLNLWTAEILSGKELMETSRLWSLMSLEAWVKGHQERWRGVCG
jgi:asparagine synthase (glutamine-hydrolysing)